MTTVVKPASTPKIMGKSDITSHNKIRFDNYDFDGYGTFRFRSLTEKEASQFERSMLNSKCEVDPRRAVEARRRLIILSSVDGNNAQNFRQTKEDFELLEQMDRRLTGLMAEAAEKTTGIKIDKEAVVKNSDETTADAST